jgi:hypothetical protein
MKKHIRSCAPCLAILALTLLVAPAFSQVPQGMAYTGRLVNAGGVPLAGPVNLELRIFDAATGPDQLYSEQHLGVPLDASGGFSVQLGLGASPVGTFSAALFSGVDRWIEVVVDGETLTPRQVIGSVPWALIAQQAERVVPRPGDPNATPRFEDCGDGTVADRKTGLLWEKKTGIFVGPVSCENPGCPDFHNVNNLYKWSTLGAPNRPNGSAFTDFLASLNSGAVAMTAGEALGDPAAEPKGRGSDWRLPTIGELRTILIGVHAAPGQATTCPAAPCIDPEFAAVGGPTASSDGYWSASTDAGQPIYAWYASFNIGNVFNDSKSIENSVRAVRTGSCN